MSRCVVNAGQHRRGREMIEPGDRAGYSVSPRDWPADVADPAASREDLLETIDQFDLVYADAMADLRKSPVPAG